MGWIKPKLAQSRKNFETLKENQYFILERQTVSAFQRFISSSVPPFRILLKSGQKGEVIVAECNEEAEARKLWRWHESVLGKAEDIPQTETVQYLLQKIEEVLKTEESEDLDKTEVYFKETFQLPSEHLVTYFSCSVWKKVMRQGSMYVSENYLCFRSKNTNENIVFAFKDITSMQKETLYLVQCIKVVSKSQEIYFSSFLNIDKTFVVLERLWTRAMEKTFEVTNSARKMMDLRSSLEMRNSASKLPTAPRKKTLYHSNSTSRPPLVHSRSSTTFEMLDSETRNTSFRSKFKLPPEEVLVDEVPCSLGLRNFQTNFEGTLYISHNFVSFCAKLRKSKDKEPTNITVSIPFSEIQSIEKQELPTLLKTETVVITTRRTQWRGAAEAVYRQCKKFWEQPLISKEDTVALHKFLEGEAPLSFVDEDQFIHKQNWDKYFQNYGRAGLCMIRDSSALLDLLKDGCMENHRGVMWLVCSGAINWWCSKPKYYQDLLNELKENQSMQVPWIEDIDKDLHRSFPQHPFYQKKENLQPLRRVLMAYALRNPSLGYCQSMNVVCALLLLIVSEEAAFWILAAICESLVPEYYSKALLGSIVDQLILEDLAARELPEVCAHLQRLGISLGVLTCPWLMCLFVGYLPLEASCRVLDLFLYEGRNTLFKVALAVLQENEDIILMYKDVAQIVLKLKEKLYENSSSILKVAFERYKSLEVKDTAELSHKWKAINDLQNDTKNHQLQTLAMTTKFTKEELLDLYHKFHSIIPMDSSEEAIEFSQYQLLLCGLIPQWKENETVHKLMWEKFNLDSKMGFAEFTFSLSSIRKGSLPDRVSFCLELFDEDEDGRLSADELVQVVYALTALYDQSEKMRNLSEAFVSMIFEKEFGIEKAKDKGLRLSFDTLKQLMLGSQLLQEFFQLSDTKKYVLPQSTHPRRPTRSTTFSL